MSVSLGVGDGVRRGQRRGWPGLQPPPGGARASYRVDPAVVVGDPGEDGGLAVVVAAQGGPEADYAMHLPLAAGVLAVEWAS